MPKSIPVIVEDDNKCDRCMQSKCCRYITQAIDAPRSIRDFDNLLWQVSHEGVCVYKEKSGWYLQIFSSCSHLQQDGRCGIYEERPLICREYSNDECEFDSEPEDGCDLFFRDYDSLNQYCQGRFKRWGKRFDKA